MNFTEYQTLAARTQNKRLNNLEKCRHALYGLSAEVGEVLGLYQKEFQGHAHSVEALEAEIGDCLWMLAELCDANGLMLDAVAFKNIEKLKKRYPDGFTVKDSLFRAVDDV